MLRVETSDGIELVCDEAGRATGRVAILLHGLTGTAGVWSDTAPALAPRFRVLLPDLRGHGGSGRSDDESAYTLERVALDVVEILDSAGAAAATVIGHGLGGSVAQLVALEHPGRVEALVLVGTGPGPLDPDSGWAKTRMSIADVASQDGIEAAWDHYVESGLIGWELDDVPGEITARWREQFVRTAPAALAGLVRSSALQTDRTAELATIGRPVLVVVGDDDAAFAEAAGSLADAVPGAELVVLEGGGHSPQITRAEAFNEGVFDFLRRALPSRRR